MKSPKKVVGTVAELFAGVGGFRVGLARNGWETVFSNQWEPSTKAQHASDVYVARFGSEGHTNVDIATVENLPSDVDLLVGGFPCQDYSVAKSANSARGLEGKKGVLWWEILRLVNQHKPKFVFLENVDRLLKSPSPQRGRDFAIMLRTLGDAGYSVEWRVVNSAEYGFPQRRKRVFIVGQRASTPEMPAKRILESGVLARALPVMADGDLREIKIDEDVVKLTRNFNNGGKISPFLASGYYKNGTAYTMKTKANWTGVKSTLGDVLVQDKDVPEEYWVSEDQIPQWEYLKGAKTISRVHAESGAEYNYSEGKMAFPDEVGNPSRTILTGEGGTSPSRFKHIIERPRGFRRLTPIELERLNGFDDDWTARGAEGNPISDARRAFFMGNALVIGLVEKVGSVLAHDMSG